MKVKVTFWPTIALTSVLAASTSTTGATGVATVAEQEPAHTPPDGGVTVAVLLIVAGGAAPTAALIWYCTLPPTGRTAIVSLIAPLPDAFGQDAPPLAVHVHIALAMPAGRGSVMSVFGAATEPEFSTTIVYAIVPFGRATVAAVVFVIETTGPAEATAVSEQLPAHAPPAGGVIVAVFDTAAGGAAVAMAAIV
jgi:hypothetical protein